MIEFNKEQQSVIDCCSNKILVMAGAGSGKTATMVGKISKQVDEGADPLSFLVLTFTRAAALNMKERYLSTHKNQVCPNFSTFHAFCYNLICADLKVLHRLGYNTVPAICEENEERRIRQTAKLKASIKLSNRKLESGEYLSYSEKYEYEKYRRMLQRLMNNENKISFKQLMNDVVNLFINDDDCILRYKKMYKYVYVDEFQDTDPIQWKFVQTFLDTANVLVVGDVLQNIYSFRGCTNKIIKSICTDNSWASFHLSRNYRSTVNIVSYANELSSTYSDMKYRVAMTSDRSGDAVSVIRLKHKKQFSESIQDEEKDALKSVCTHLSGSVAILARTNSEVSVIKQYLDDINVLYTESHKSSDVPSILHSVIDNEYLMNWTSSFLKSEEYANYQRWLTLWIHDNDCKPTLKDYVDRYKRFSKINCYLSSVFAIRKLLMSKITARDKILKISQCLGISIQDTTDINESFSNGEILRYILDKFNDSVQSDIYVGTIHSVKGLEYDNVLLLGVNDKSWPLNTEDNLNLFYVGITRAKSKLYVFQYKER